jgi:elongation factor Ts
MVEVTAALVKQLRDATNVGMMECKRALVEAGGDVDNATRLLRERGMAVAAKKASRATNQGLVASAARDDGRTVSLVEVNCETDFVARNETFKEFVASIALRACDTDDPLTDLMKEELTARIAEIGENMVISRNTRYELQDTGRIGSYIHLGGKVGVLVEVGCTRDETATGDGFAELVKNLCLHVAACAPVCILPEEVPEDTVASEREIYAKQVQGKPEQIIDKIVEGKLKKYFKEICLIEQAYVREPKQSVRQLLESEGKALDDTLAIRRFVRYQVGQ